MTRSQLLVAMFEAAAPVVRSYWTDLRHDARLIDEAEPNSTFLWTPRESGTFIVLLERGLRPNSRAVEIFSAMNAQESGLQWHSIRLFPQTCSIVPVLAEDALAMAKVASDRAANSADHVSELHI
jgi:hypothetical protein